MLGSVTARVIGHTDRDALVVPHDTALSFKRILVATDGSLTSVAGAEHAINIAASYGGELIALSVVDLPDEAYADAPKVADQLLEKAKSYVAAIKAQADAAGVPCSVAPPSQARSSTW